MWKTVGAMISLLILATVSVNGQAGIDPQVLSKAKAGDPKAEFLIGKGYCTGVPQDQVEAVRWWRMAADQGYVSAQVGLGAAYNAGKGVPKDQAQAVIWYRKAAEQGSAWAQNDLGEYYEEGIGVPQDYA
jgi:hypothetical protein